ncbi:hydroxyacylglutathione hydrolase [Magnetospirillum fulvum]|uniref:Hydroxyacylglutathione hydrolase n=1 Tax=Magnetospirillum fulvum MGU-K5 TaxID=1316936 RepID=S9SAU6_MAGFU|nr:hydroxyacylglutathione hydrolase [Magnetospirillum fulvum]EPY01173.1 Zn-dependent hydrolase, including glyoxylase [Magnetospirillum fulvum MGU-K5]
MAKLVVEIVPVLTDNYVYLLHEPISGATAAIDPGAAAPVLERLAARGWSLSHILLTHHHGDHTGGTADLVRQTGCAVVGSGRDASRLPPLDVEVGGRDTFMLGSAAAMVLTVPGHTTDHLAYWFPDSHALFCGDVLFSLGCGRLFEGTAAEMWASLCKLRDLPPETLVYCGHEYTAANGRFARLVERDNRALLIRLEEIEAQRAKGKPTLPSTIASERAANPFLRADEPAVARAVGMEPGTDPVRVLAELRRRKDVF